MNIRVRIWDTVNKEFLPIMDSVQVSYFHIVHDEKLRTIFWSRTADELIECRSTGLKDKDGTEIFEGDYVRYTWERDEHETEEDSGEVYWEDGCFFFDKINQFCWHDSNFLQKTVKIIGNKFQQ